MADFSASIGKAWDDSAVEARKKVVASGAEFYTIPASELQAWRGVSDRLTASWIDEMKGRGYDGQAMVDDARALIATHSK